MLMHVEEAVILLITLALLAYLFFALLRPEKF
ncbi:MAG: K(+)-transporting ATPase subunit F [Acidobacteriales bacterium]|nr:K(+)-transporting ATPase subunit F [Terriglobales bacterium]